METIDYSQTCNSNKDCKSNVCELIYESGKAKGRYCLTNTDNKYTIECSSQKDCNSGECQEIYDNNGKYITSRCLKAPKIDRDSAFNNLFGSDRSNEYGALNSHAIALKVGDKGPITEVIIKVFSIIANLFNILVFNFNVCGDNKRQAQKKGCKKGEIWSYFKKCHKRPYRGECNIFREKENNGILYVIAYTIIDGVYGAVMKNQNNSSLFWNGIQGKHYNKCTGKCKKTAGGIDLWYFRSLLTILFPPLGIFLAKGFSGIKQIFICSILTICFYFPGLIYAIAVINNSEAEIDELIKIKNNII